MKRIIATLPFVLILAVSACEVNRNIPPLGKDFGNATTHNFSQHIINPEPVTAGYGAPALHGTRAKGAMDRYTGGTVIAPEAEDTGGVGGGS
jgi:hypothetical protein